MSLSSTTKTTGPIREDLIRASLSGSLQDIEFEIYRQIDSTNDRALAASKTFGGSALAVLSASQTCGRGTKGRSFHSPCGGLYMSLLVPIAGKDPQLITPAAALSAAKAAERVSGKRADIKWINDIIIDGKKVCGILTEASFAGKRQMAVIGVGANVCGTDAELPDELKDLAAFMSIGGEGLRELFAAVFLNEFMTLLSDLRPEAFYDEYRLRLALLGREISVSRSSGTEEAFAKDLLGDFRLLVCFPDGKEEALRSDEVSLKIK